jgi:hypothetical protein
LLSLIQLSYQKLFEDMYAPSIIKSKRDNSVCDRHKRKIAGCERKKKCNSLGEKLPSMKNQKAMKVSEKNQTYSVSDKSEGGCEAEIEKRQKRDQKHCLLELF